MCTTFAKMRGEAMTSVTGSVHNKTGETLTFSVGSTDHGDSAIIEFSTLADGQTENVFMAHSSGAGVEGTVNAKTGDNKFTLSYDNPVVGSNEGSVSAPAGYGGTVVVGHGVNPGFVYTLTKDAS